MNPISSFRKRYAFLKGNFLLITITWVLMFFAVPIPNTYASKYFKDVLGADDFTLSVINFVGMLALALVQFPGGYFADKHGRRWLIYSMTFGVALSSLFFVFAPSWEYVALGMMIQNFCLLYQPALFALMLDSVSPENRGAGFTFQSVVTNLVGLPAAIIAGYLILVFQFNLGMRIAYGIVTVAYFAAALLRAKLKETLPSADGSVRLGFFEALREYPRSVKESLAVWRKVPKTVFHMFVSNAVMSSLIAGCNTYFVVYALEVLKVEKFQWALVMAFMSLSIAIPTISAGLRMDRAGRKRFLIAGYFCYGPAMLIFINAGFYQLLPAFFFFGLGQMLQSSSYQSLLGDLTPREYRGKVVGCSQFFIYLSQAPTQLLVGVLYAYVWKPLPFVMLAVATLPICLFVYLKVFESTAKEI
ncbi:MFS transporter [Candidatus Bathyarchaeota archaeon]|nr:MFS transporter [Candidatus Bathyarchaeota archaeon]